MKDLGKRSSTYLLVTGVLGIVFGIMMMAWPGATALALVLVWGIYALLDGLFAFFSAFQHGESGGMRFFLIFMGIIGVLAGLIAIFRPIGSAVVLTIVLGVWLIVRGIGEIVAGFSGDTDSRWMSVLAGVLWIIAGGLFIANPGAGILTVALFVGIMSVVWGGIAFWQGWKSRGEVKQATA